MTTQGPNTIFLIMVSTRSLQRRTLTGRVYEKKKMRIVSDAAARYKGRCLNDTLYPGPKMQNELPTVLIRF